MRISVILASMLACVSTPAWAGWDFTEWDMSPAQVAAASDGQVDITPYDPKTVPARQFTACSGEIQLCRHRIEYCVLFRSQHREIACNRSASGAGKLRCVQRGS